ncbi:hypothetical protein JY651_28750 [Pyxidicoccus parkwayensis]|uniref:Uncharacterized protein n=1 Tax=Pyxidicoccus parkwayensis TaxID=2813578 RepID=A0ABX7NKE3_9BACT|nr:hypothetical protein [Pyxidicoccus parkwaysis]QSQ19322.1 hypothetical protein JY651_28750 [Pyxidicoccus parkwaysis]
MSLMGHRFVHTFHVARWLSTNARGEHEYSAPEPHACRYQGSVKRLVAADGTDATSEAVLFTHVKVELRDTVYPPGADVKDVGAGKQPLRVTPLNNLDGQLDHYEVYL